MDFSIDTKISECYDSPFMGQYSITHNQIIYTIGTDM